MQYVDYLRTITPHIRTARAQLAADIQTSISTFDFTLIIIKLEDKQLKKVNLPKTVVRFEKKWSG